LRDGGLQAAASIAELEWRHGFINRRGSKLAAFLFRDVDASDEVDGEKIARLKLAVVTELNSGADHPVASHVTEPSFPPAACTGLGEFSLKWYPLAVSFSHLAVPLLPF
jgi:hypothetical protein